MKISKNKLMILGILIFVAVGVLLTSYLLKGEEDVPTLELDKKWMFFHEFEYKENNTVVLRCEIRISNNSEKKRKFYLMMDVSAEHDRDFVRQDYAISCQENGDKIAMFELAPKEEKAFEIYFKAIAGSTKTKKDRLLPGDIYIVPIE